MTVSPGMDCPQCDGVGYNYRVAGPLQMAGVPTISLNDPDAIARFSRSGVWCTLADVERWIEAIALSEDWVHGQGLCLHMDLVTVLLNVRDLVDTGAPVLLRGEEIRQLYNAFLAVRFDAERRLASEKMEEG